MKPLFFFIFMLLTLTAGAKQQKGVNDTQTTSQKQDEAPFLNSFWEANNAMRNERFEDACGYYNTAVKAGAGDKYMAMAYNNWGNALYNLGEMRKDRAAFEESIEKYGKSIKLNPDNAYAYINWGAALSELGKIQKNKQLFEKSIEKYNKAIELKPDCATAYSNWGAALCELGKMQKDKQLFERSIEKYNKALELDPNFAEAYSNLGAALSEMAKMQGKFAAHRREVSAMLFKAESIKEGVGSYNIACMHALLGNKVRSLKWLKKDIQYNTLTRELIDNDSDFDKIRDTRKFKLLLDKYFPLVSNRPVVELPAVEPSQNEVTEREKAEPVAQYTFSDWYMKAFDAQKNGEYEDACFYCSKAIETGAEPEFEYMVALAYYDWGNALLRLGEIRDNRELLEQSIEKYKQATDMLPGLTNAYKDWGNALAYLGKIKSDKELFNQSFEKYKRATDLEPRFAEAYSDWGNALVELGKIKNDDRLFEQSFEKYKKATKVDPDYVEAYSDWGNALLELGKMKGDIASYRGGIESLSVKAESVKEGAGSYNLASLYSLLDYKEDAIKWLERDLQYNRHTKNFIEKEEDFVGIKERSDFKALLNKYLQPAK